MMPEEKTQLLALFDSESKWCQGSEALDVDGEPVRYNDESAVAWDLVGGMCHLFGWHRARTLFAQLIRHIVGRQRPQFDRDEQIAAMSALFDFNDAIDTTYAKIVATLQGVPVWHGRPSLVDADPMGKA